MNCKSQVFNPDRYQEKFTPKDSFGQGTAIFVFLVT